ncbi:MAG: 2-amino-4-hydroxy-6-hydroxymethyldihydropteridine diphosphokinase [Mycobacterium sp.]|nr:2-amino-4-hydroxy-6-hydroxymethyldihydropteridine diphosphokinase [Mycobacterium sp.]
MSRVVLSIGSNMGDRLARLQSVIDGLEPSVVSISPVFETDAWGGVEQDAFLNAVVIADDPELDARGWLSRGQELERDNQRVRDKKWGPRTLDVDVVSCRESGADGGHVEVVSDDPVLTLPHPLAHQRAFVLIPWLAADPDAQLLLDGRHRPVSELIEALDPADRSGVRRTGLPLQRGPR